ncbi:AfsR/SARP family transcriptional regulator [Streptomyces toxytricini]|uniref:AfsR/SARP family transcriptional regulator n=1 Tax=Streptomyces toxytricini TaxID=67369 RepID=A0ABW8EIY6_STRT5
MNEALPAATAAHDPDASFSLLGPVQAHHGALALPLGPPQQRAVLAMLLCRHNTVVGTGELVDGLWGEAPPHTAVGTVRSYVYRLRRILGARITTHGQGYRLRLGHGELDLCRFEDLVAEARGAAADGNPAAARDGLAEGLGLWRGTPLAGLPGPQARIQRERLAELRLSVLVERIELDVLLGRHARLVGELTGLCAEHPRNDRLRALLDTVLERSGRGREARTAPSATGTADGRTAGPRPGAAPPPAGGPAAQAATAPPGGGTSGDARHVAPPPAQLPYVPVDFTGRSGPEQSIVDALAPAPGAGAALRSAAISAVGGIGGVGKTTLAVHAAQRLRDHFPDGQLYANLRGVREDPAEPGAVLASFLRALGVADAAVPDDPEERAALYRSRLTGRRVLLVLDDARDTAQVEPLLPDSPTCAVLVTSRHTLPGLPASLHLRLDVLPDTEALAMLGRIVGEARIAAEPDAALALVGRCGALPLALRLAGSRLATRPAWALADYVRLLDGARPALLGRAGGQGGADGVEACFRLSYDLLDPEQARLFRLLSLPRAATLDTAGAAALAGMAEAEAEGHLERIAALGLLESPAPGVHRLHDLLREFAAARSRGDDTPADRAAALLRLLAHVRDRARAAYTAERPGHPLAAPAGPPAPAPVPAGLPFDHACVLAVAVQAVEAAPQAVGPAADTVLALEPLLDGSFLWGALVSPARGILGTAQARGDIRAAGRIGHMLGAALMRLGRLDEADRVLQDADRAARTCDDIIRAEILTTRALVRQALSDWETAGALYREAVDTGTRCGNGWGVGHALSNSVGALLRSGRAADADAAARAALDAARARGDRYAEAHALYSQGIVARHTGRTEEAVARHRESAALGTRHGYPAYAAMNLVSQTAALLAGDRARDAADCGERAVEATRRVGWRAAEARALRLLGTALAFAGDREAAAARLGEAVRLLDALALPEAADARTVLATLTAPDPTDTPDPTPGADPAEAPVPAPRTADPAPRPPGSPRTAAAAPGAAVPAPRTADSA